MINCARTAALRRLGEAIAQEVSQSAGRMAKTQDEVARVHDAIAGGVSTCAVHARNEPNGPAATPATSSTAGPPKPKKTDAS